MTNRCEFKSISDKDMTMDICDKYLDSVDGKGISIIMNSLFLIIQHLVIGVDDPKLAREIVDSLSEVSDRLRREVNLQ